jgi:hypothetical protein
MSEPLTAADTRQQQEEAHAVLDVAGAVVAEKTTSNNKKAADHVDSDSPQAKVDGVYVVNESAHASNDGGTDILDDDADGLISSYANINDNTTTTTKSNNNDINDMNIHTGDQNDVKESDLEPNSTSDADNHKDDRRQVRFSTTTSTRLIPASGKSRPTATGWDDQSRRIYVGKASPLRDIGIFLSVICFLLWAGSQFEPDIKPEKKTKKSTDMNNMWSHLAKLVPQEKKVRRAETCSLFMHTSSIPRAGPGLFAGQDYAIDDEVVSEPAFYMPMSTQDTHAISKEATVWVHPYAYLIKHHPTLANVQGTLWITDSDEGKHKAMKSKKSQKQLTLSLRAMRPIDIGEEIFVSWSDHPHSLMNNMPFTQSTTHLSLFQHIPTNADYDKADAIFNDLQSTIRRMQGAHRQRQINVDSSFLFTLVYRTALALQPQIAALLPQSKADGQARMASHQSSRYSSLKNVTLVNLQTMGRCLSDTHIMARDNAKSENEGMHDEPPQSLIATRQFQPDDLVLPVPLAVVDRSSQSSKQKHASRPTIATPWVEGEHESVYALTHLSIMQQDSDSANVELRWISAEPRHNLSSYSNQPAGTLSMGVYALQEISRGERVSC